MQAYATVPMTAEAIDELERELDHLRTTRRREVAQLMRQTRENDRNTEGAPAADVAADEQAFVEGRIHEVEQILARARPIDRDAGRRSGRVALGATVTVEDMQGRERTYIVVSAAETDPSRGKVSDESPVGRALIGAAPGDTVLVKAPAGQVRLTVRRIE